MNSVTTNWCELLHLTERAALVRELTRERLGEFIPESVPEQLTPDSIDEQPTLMVDEENLRQLHGLDRPLRILTTRGQPLGLFIPESDHEREVYERLARPEVREAIVAAVLEYHASEPPQS